MRPIRLVAVIVLQLGALVAFAAAEPAPTRLTLTAPSSVDLGEEILVEAHLTTAQGQAVAGARLELRQVGAVGERMMTQATTDADGRVTFAHREYSVAALTLRVAFPGSVTQGPSQADAVVAISGVTPAPSVVMYHSPSPVTKGILFTLLGAVWLTYIYAASCVVRVARETPGR